MIQKTEVHEVSDGTRPKTATPRGRRLVRNLQLAAALSLTGALQLGATAADAQATPIVDTVSGPVQGTEGEDGVSLFLGIPYAAPPVGDLRWSVPTAPEPWTEPLAATDFGGDCAQVKELGDFGAPTENEDCLYLNVFAPEGAQNRPVMFWIHGGESTGSSASYDGTALATEQDVVVVTINYRMGVLGDLIHPAFDGDGETTIYGLRDQQFAMQWVKDNIAGFGGDPENVTLFGESTGATDILFHIISPAAEGLFAKAILHSPARYFNPSTPLADAEAMGESFAAAVGCDDQSAECLRQVPVADLLANQGWFSSDCCASLPIVDGHVLTGNVQDAIRSGEFNQVPIMGMITRDENRWFEAFFGEVSGAEPLTADAYPEAMAAAYGDDAEKVLAAYPLEDFDSPAGARAAASSDNGAICQPRSFNIDASKFVPVYQVEFADPESPGILPPVSFPLLASHTHEMQYIFAGWKGVHEGDVPALTEEQQELAIDMRKIWGTFATTGAMPEDVAPGVTGPDQVVVLETPEITVISDEQFAANHKCELWDDRRGWSPLQ